MARSRAELRRPEGLAARHLRFRPALGLRRDDVEILVLRAAAWRNAGNSAKAYEDATRASKIAPDHSEALLERGFANLARGDRGSANLDFSAVLRLVPPGSSAARGAEAGLRGEQPPAAAPVSPSTPPFHRRVGGRSSVAANPDVRARR